MSRPLVLHVFKCIYAGTLPLSGVPLSHAEELVYYVGQDFQVLTTGPAYMRYSGTLKNLTLQIRKDVRIRPLPPTTCTTQTIATGQQQSV